MEESQAMLARSRRSVFHGDVAVSAVIGAILMIAATVVLGGVIYAAVNGFGSARTSGPTIQAIWRAEPVDTDGDGQTDAIKFLYMTGPADFPNPDVHFGIYPNGVYVAVPPPPDLWNPGDFIVVTVPQDTYTLTVSMRGNTFLETTLRVGPP